MAKTQEHCRNLYLRHAGHYTIIKLALKLQICICHTWTSRPTDITKFHHRWVLLLKLCRQKQGSSSAFS